MVSKWYEVCVCSLCLVCFLYLACLVQCVFLGWHLMALPHVLTKIVHQATKMGMLVVTRVADVARAALTERSGSSAKGRTPNIRYFVAKLSIVAIYTLFERLSQGFQ